MSNEQVTQPEEETSQIEVENTEEAEKISNAEETEAAIPENQPEPEAEAEEVEAALTASETEAVEETPPPPPPPVVVEEPQPQEPVVVEPPTEIEAEKSDVVAVAQETSKTSLAKIDSKLSSKPSLPKKEEPALKPIIEEEPPSERRTSITITDKEEPKYKDSLSSIESFDERRSSEDAKYGVDGKEKWSKAKIALGDVIDIRGSSQGGDYDGRIRVARYMNSYKMESDNPYNTEKVYNILQSVMTEALDNLTYDSEKCPKQAKWASQTIRSKIKELDFDRYKLICLVTIGEKHFQDVLASCRFLWDTEKDRYTTFSLENTTVFGFAQCFGLYYE